MVANRFVRYRKIAIHWACWLAALVGVFYLCGYLIDARLRATKGPNCKGHAIPNPDNTPYSARWCFLNNDTIWVRLYDASGQTLLAERTHHQHGWADHSVLTPDMLMYDTNPDDAYIALPPSLLDRLRAKLP